MPTDTEPQILPTAAKPAHCPTCNGTDIGTKPGSYYCKTSPCTWRSAKYKLA